MMTAALCTPCCGMSAIEAVGGVVVSQPLVVPGVRVQGGTATLVIVGSANGNVYALKAGTGTVVWRRFLGVQHTGCTDFPNGRYGVTDTPAVDATAGRVYVAGADGKLYSLVLRRVQPSRAGR